MMVQEDDDKHSIYTTVLHPLYNADIHSLQQIGCNQVSHTGATAEAHEHICAICLTVREDC